MQRIQLDKRYTSAFLAGAALLGFGLVGCGGGGEDPGTASQTSGSGGSGAGTGSATPGPSLGGGGGAPLGGGGGFGGGGQQQAAVGGGAPIDSSMPPSSRQDPFKIPWPIPDPPIGDIVPPVRVANWNTHEVDPTQTIEVQEAPTSRAAGIMISNGVWAIIEGPLGPPQIVRPGDTIGDYHVESINSSSVILKRTEGNQIITQIVPLTDAGSAPPPARGGGGGGLTPGGFGGGPGGLSAPGGLPGAGGRGGAGKAD